MEGLIGLQNNIKTTESAVRDLSVLERMDARIEKDRQAEVIAQQQEQLLYEKAYQMSDQLLEKDRNKINARFRMAQNQIAEHLMLSGGSRQTFMEQGGLSVINNISNGVMRSPEAVRYQENQKNLARIYEAQMKGLGHLISPKDLQSLEDYHNSEDGGTITFSGMLAEIKIPPSQNFDYGTDIPYEKIMSYDSNMIRIRQNFEIVHPDKEFNYANVVAFMKEMGYGGQGSNETQMRLEAQKSIAISRANKNKPTKTPNTILGNYTLFKQELDSAIPQGITLENIEKIEQEKGKDFIEYLKGGQNPMANKLLHNKSGLVSRKRHLPEKGLDRTDFQFSDQATPIERMFNEMYGLKNSYQILPASAGTISHRILGNKNEAGMGYEIKDGKVLNFAPSSSGQYSTYRMDGVKLSSDNQLEEDNKTVKGDYKIEGIVTGWKGKDSDGNENLIMNAYDDDGKTIDSKTTKNIHDAYKGQGGGDELQFTTLIALRNPNTDDLYYMEIPIDMPDIKRALDVSMGDDNDIAGQTLEENEKFMAAASIDQLQREELVKMQGTVNRADEDVFQDPIFEQEGSKYWGAYSGGQQNRYPLMKSFYMAFDHVARTEQEGVPAQYDKESLTDLVDSNFFTKAAIHGNVEDQLKDYKVNDLQIIQGWLTNINESAESALTKQRNQEIAVKWAQMNELIRRNQ
jgi:hypothetical protein